MIDALTKEAKQLIIDGLEALAMTKYTKRTGTWLFMDFQVNGGPVDLDAMRAFQKKLEEQEEEIRSLKSLIEAANV